MTNTVIKDIYRIKGCDAMTPFEQELFNNLKAVTERLEAALHYAGKAADSLSDDIQAGSVSDAGEALEKVQNEIDDITANAYMLDDLNNAKTLIEDIESNDIAGHTAAS